MLHVDKDDLSPTAEVWDVDQGLISKLKEQYKKERKGKKGVKSKCRFWILTQLSELCGEQEVFFLNVFSFFPSALTRFYFGGNQL